MSNFNQFNLENFPIHALGELLGGAVCEATQATSNSASPNAVAILAVASLCAQGLVEVEKRPGLISPIGQFFAVIQPSGERKSASLSKVLPPLNAFATEASALHKAALAEFEAAMAAWRAEERGIQASIRRKAELTEQLDEERQRLREHARSKPNRPKRFKLVHENVTPTALWSSLAESIPTTSLISDEGHLIISSRALSDPGLLNKAWDSSTLIIDRATAGELFIEKPALTVLLQFQPGVFQQLLTQKGELLRDSGFFARCFVIAPPVMAGSRFLAYAPTLDTQNLVRFHERCTELLNAHKVDDQGQLLPRRTLEFSPEAQARWEYEHDLIEQAMQPNGFYFQFRDFASKQADKIARLAALLHTFEEHEGPISTATLERAIIIGNWFAGEFVRIFTPPPPVPEGYNNALTVQEWLVNFFKTTGFTTIRKNEILQLGPNPVRAKAALNGALVYLKMWGVVIEWKSSEDRKTYISLTEQFVNQYVFHR